jgi:hypothetical protein
MAAQLVASRVILSSTELVSFGGITGKHYAALDRFMEILLHCKS